MPYDFDAVDYENAEELSTFNDGDKVAVIIQAVQVNEEQYWIRCTLECPTDELSKEISHFLSLPSPDEGLRSRRKSELRIKHFTEAFSISREEWREPETWVGHSAEATLGEKMDDQYGNQNFVKQFSAPA